MASIRSVYAFTGNRTVVRCAVTILYVLIAPAGLAQALVAAPKLEFDVPSVRPNKSDDRANSNVPLGPGDTYVPNG